MSTRATLNYSTRPRRAAPLLGTVDSSRPLKVRERAALDWYVEPAWCVNGLFDVQEFRGNVLDPACGRGTIPSIWGAHGLEAFASDLEDRGYLPPPFVPLDFIVDWPAWKRVGIDNIICNPPFNLAEEFLDRALRVARRKVALLLRWSWAEGRGRRWVWDSTPLAALHPFANRVSMPPGGAGVEARGGAVAFAWFVWDHAHNGAPIVRRIERGAA